MTRPLLLALLLAAGCRDASPDATAPAAPVAESTGAPSAEAHTDTAGPATPPPDSVWVGDPPTRVPAPYRTLPDGWTTGVVRTPAPAVAPVQVRALRTARHDGFDRLVLDLDGPAPGVAVEYVDRPVRACGSGEPVPLAGDAWLAVRLSPSRAHTDAGRSTLDARRARPDHPALVEWAVTCDFEAEWAVVLGVASPEAYRVQRLRAPDRLVVDVRHRGAGRAP